MRSRAERPRGLANGAFRRLGESNKTAVRAALRDATTLEIVSTVICWMFEEATAAPWRVRPQCDDRASHGERVHKGGHLARSGRTHRDAPLRMGAATVRRGIGRATGELRLVAGPSYRRYVNRLTDAMTSLSQRTDAATPTDTYNPDQLAGEVHTLRRLMRDLPWLGRGYVGFGLTGNAGLPRLRDAEEVIQTLSTRGPRMRWTCGPGVSPSQRGPHGFDYRDQRCRGDQTSKGRLLPSVATTRQSSD